MSHSQAMKDSCSNTFVLLVILSSLLFWLHGWHHAAYGLPFLIFNHFTLLIIVMSSLLIDDFQFWSSQQRMHSYTPCRTCLVISNSLSFSLISFFKSLGILLAVPYVLQHMSFLFFSDLVSDKIILCLDIFVFPMFHCILNKCHLIYLVSHVVLYLSKSFLWFLHC